MKQIISCIIISTIPQIIQLLTVMALQVQVPLNNKWYTTSSHTKLKSIVRKYALTSLVIVAAAENMNAL